MNKDFVLCVQPSTIKLDSEWEQIFANKELKLITRSNTKWIAYESDGECWYFLLRPGGLVEITEYNVTLINGKWQQEGASFYMGFSNKYSQYRGILGNNELTGEAQNVKGKEWT